MPAGRPRLTHGEVMDQGLAAKHPALLFENYKGSKVTHKYRFLDCGHVWEITPDRLHQGRGCGVCRFDQGPTYVYLLQHEGFNAFKIGITAVEDKKRSDGYIRKGRICQLGKKGWELIHKVKCETRAEAEAAEKAILKSWRDQYFPVALTWKQLPGGYGETVSRMYIAPTEILAMMETSLIHT